MPLAMDKNPILYLRIVEKGGSSKTVNLELSSLIQLIV